MKNVIRWLERLRALIFPRRTSMVPCAIRFELSAIADLDFRAVYIRLWSSDIARVLSDFELEWLRCFKEANLPPRVRG